MDDSLINKEISITIDELSSSSSQSSFSIEEVEEPLQGSSVNESIEEKELSKLSKLVKFKAGDALFPKLWNSTRHTLAFLLKEPYNVADELRPYPATYQPIWSPQYVKMPCHPNYTITRKIRDSQGVFTTFQVNFWEFFKVTLLEKKIESTEDLIGRLKKIINSSRDSYNVLFDVIEIMLSPDERDDFYKRTLPHMIFLATELPNLVTCPLPLLMSGKNGTISLSQRQIGSILANAFFSSFPDQGENLPSINFYTLYSCHEKNERIDSIRHKLRTILNYFQRLSSPHEAHNGVVSFTRRSNFRQNAHSWENSAKKFKNLVVLSNGTIETQGSGLIQVDFANKIIGGGVLSSGAVQEEILFVIFPELLTSRLFTPQLSQFESLIVTGVERYSDYSGYSSSFKYSNSYYDVIESDSRGRKLRQFVCIDALYVSGNYYSQFNPKLMARELNKAYVGFSLPSLSPNLIGIASGKWGCGAFKGDPILKSILQLLAASEAERDLVLFTFSDSGLQKNLLDIYDIIKNKTIGEVWKLLVQYSNLFCSSLTNSQLPSYTLLQYLNEFVSMSQIFSGDENSNQESITNSLQKSENCQETPKFVTVKKSPHLSEEQSSEEFMDSEIFDVSEFLESEKSEHLLDEPKKDEEKSEPNFSKNLIINKTDVKSPSSSFSGQRTKVTDYFSKKSPPNSKKMKRDEEIGEKIVDFWTSSLVSPAQKISNSNMRSSNFDECEDNSIDMDFAKNLAKKINEAVTDDSQN